MTALGNMSIVNGRFLLHQVSRGVVKLRDVFLSEVGGWAQENCHWNLARLFTRNGYTLVILSQDRQAQITKK